MAEMFRLLKELTTSRNPKKVLVREEARHPVTKHVNSISLIKIEEEKSVKNNKGVDKNVVEPDESYVVEPIEVVDMKKEVENGMNNEAIWNVKEEITGEGIKELVEIPRSQPIGYYLKHEINKELIEGLIGNQRTYVQRNRQEEDKKEDMEGNFVIPCNVGGLKYMDTLVDQGSDVNIMTLSIYNRLTNEKPVGTHITLFIASHSYIFPLGIVKDVLVEIAGYVYPIDFVILDVKEDKKKPFILGTPFLTTAKAEVRVEVEIKNDIDPVAFTNAISRLILEWEERIKLYREKELEFNQWRSKVFNDGRSVLMPKGCEEITNRFACKNNSKKQKKLFTDAGDGVGINPDGVANPELL
ncbi:MAK10-like protein [Tanacetum coccineum]